MLRGFVAAAAAVALMSSGALAQVSNAKLASAATSAKSAPRPASSTEGKGGASAIGNPQGAGIWAVGLVLVAAVIAALAFSGGGSSASPD